MNFKYDKGLIWVSVQVVYEGRSVLIDNCVLDTGSATTAVDIDQIELNYSIPAKIRRLYGVGGGTQDVIVQNVNALGFEDIQVANVDLEFGDLKGRFGINGFIGNDILSRFKIEIDYSEEVLLLSTRNP